MQIPSIPPPLITNPLPQDVAAKAVSNVQAVAPLVQRSVDPSPKSEKFNESRTNKDKGRSGGRDDNHTKSEEKGNGERGNSVNIDV